MLSLFSRVSVIVAACALSGCAVPLFAGITLNQMSTAGSVVSTLATGKGLGDHALDVVTGDDCRFLEGLMSKDRKICEKPGAPNTAGDFQGLASLDSKQPAAKRPSAQEHSVGPMASTLADRNFDRPAKAKPMQVAAARPVPATAPAAPPRTSGAYTASGASPQAAPAVATSVTNPPIAAYAPQYY